MTRSFLITQPPDSLHDLRISRSEGAHPLIYISTNHRTFSLDDHMARELSRGLLAILSGSFDEALTETALLAREEDLAYRLARQAQAPRPEGAARPQPSLPPSAKAPIPELDSL